MDVARNDSDAAEELSPGEVSGGASGGASGGVPDVPGVVLPVTTATLGAAILLQDPASQLVMERVGDDVAFGLENVAWSLDEMRARVPEALASVGLAGFEGRRSTRLSGGEQQRVALAGVLAPPPGVLVLDEPTAHLDPSGTEAIFGILAGLREQRAATIVLIEHRAERAWPLADVVLALDDDGRPIDVGPPAAVLKRSSKRMGAAGIWLPESPAKRAAGASREGPRDRTLGTLPVLEMRGVRFGYDRENTVLRDVDLTVGPGERVALVGANGSGKSTLLRLALGLRRPTTGFVRLGRARSGSDARRPARATRGLRGPGS